MPKCAACGTERASRWFFFKSPTGVVSACSHTCRELYLGAIDDTGDDETGVIPVSVSDASGSGKDSGPRRVS